MKLSSKEPFVKVGFVQDAHGIRGEIYVKIPSKETGWMKELKVFELQVRSEKEPSIPFTLERIKPHKEGLIVKAKEVLDRNRAEELKGHSFLIPEHFVTAQVGETVFLRELLSFEVYDQDLRIGVVSGFMDNGAHDLLQVQAEENKEHLIPFVEAFIVEIQFENKKILMSLPEGLLE